MSDLDSPFEKGDAIRVRSLIKRFGTLVAVNNVSFDIGVGEVFGVLGPNGAGKTTTLECIEGIQIPTSGTISVLGMNVQQYPSQVKERIGIQLQTSDYFDYLTLRELLSLFGRFYSRRVLPTDLLARVGLRDKGGSTVKNLSGGQRQRFSIAAAMVNNAEIMFLDEPTTGLDPQARHDVWDLILELYAEGRTIVLTTHYMEEAQALCHRVAIMDNGIIVGMDSPSNLIRSLSAPFEISGVISDATHVFELATLANVAGLSQGPHGRFTLRSSDAANTLSALIAWIELRGLRLTQLEVTRATLEDVFLSLTGREFQEVGTASGDL